jgi:diguanylate cyclase (GGDEF)-like protein/PAS domain S-box-containing protein
VTVPSPRAEASVELGTLLAELVESRRQLRAVIDSMPAMIGYWDRGLLNRLANEAYVEWFGWTPEQMLGHHISEVLGDELFAKNKPYMDAALRGEEQHFDRTIVDASGRTRYSQAAYIPDTDDEGQVHGFFVLVADVTARVTAEKELAAAKEELERLALTDVLTGLANRHSLELSLQHALAVLERTPPGTRLVALLLLDLDGFKPVNDTYGHAAGDEVLQELGRRLSHEVRAPDLVARIGGDELVVLGLDVRDHAAAEHLAERLVARVAEPVRLSTGPSVRVTASVGLAVAGESPAVPTVAELMRQADTQMYEAKNAGGNTYR